MSDVLELERTAEDRARTVRHILADLRAHEVADVTAAEIREAIELQEEETEMDRDRLPWAGVVLMALVLVVLMVLWCRGVI